MTVQSDEYGADITAAKAVIRWLSSLIKSENPDYLAVCFDESLGTGFRHLLDEGYKSSRAAADENILHQMEYVKRVLNESGVAHFASQIYEADDLIASLRSQCQCNYPELKTVVVSGDKDLGQLLISETDVLMDYSPDPRRHTVTDRDHFFSRFDVWPEQFADYLALVGDSVDDIPGVPGVGPKTASKLLQHFGDLDNLLSNAEAVESLPLRGAKTLGGKILSQASRLRLNQQLTTLIEDQSLVCSLDELKVSSGINLNRPLP